MGWNGTGLKSTWIRQQGRGNAMGRNGVGRYKPFHCDGCKKLHGSSCDHYRDGERHYCQRAFFKMIDAPKSVLTSQ